MSDAGTIPPGGHLFDPAQLQRLRKRKEADAYARELSRRSDGLSIGVYALSTRGRGKWALAPSQEAVVAGNWPAAHHFVRWEPGEKESNDGEAASEDGR